MPDAYPVREGLSLRAAPVQRRHDQRVILGLGEPGHRHHRHDPDIADTDRERAAVRGVLIEVEPRGFFERRAASAIVGAHVVRAVAEARYDVALSACPLVIVRRCSGQRAMKHLVAVANDVYCDGFVGCLRDLHETQPDAQRRVVVEAAKLELLFLLPQSPFQFLVLISALLWQMLPFPSYKKPNKLT